MNTSHSDESARAHPATSEPVNLAELLALARVGATDAQRPTPDPAADDNAAGVALEGNPYLQFICADTACAAPITHFREVLPVLPTTIALPFSPPWMLGLFALHTDLIGLVDPAPLLFNAPDLVGLSRSRAHNGQVIVPGARNTSSANWRLATPESGPTALIIGAGERLLALAVSGVGDLIYPEPGEIHDSVDSPAGVFTGGSAGAPAARFCAGTLAARAEENERNVIYVVNIGALLDELLLGLRGVEAGPHE